MQEIIKGDKKGGKWDFVERQTQGRREDGRETEKKRGGG